MPTDPSRIMQVVEAWLPRHIQRIIRPNSIKINKLQPSGTPGQVPTVHSSGDRVEWSDKGLAPFIGSLTGSGTSSQSVTGVGFRPRMVEFRYEHATGSGSIQQSHGWDDGSTVRGVAFRTSTTGDYRIASTAESLIQMSNNSTTATGLGHISSMDSDGFSISWTTTNTGVYYFVAYP